MMKLADKDFNIGIINMHKDFRKSWNIIFYPIIWVFFFAFLIISLDVQKFLILIKSNLHIFSFVAPVLGVIYKNSLTIPRTWRLTLILCSKSFIVLVFIFWSLKKLFFLYWMDSVPWSKISFSYIYRFISGLSIQCVYMFTFMPLSYCFDYYSFEIDFKIRHSVFSSFLVLFQDNFCY